MEPLCVCNVSRNNTLHFTRRFQSEHTVYLLFCLSECRWVKRSLTSCGLRLSNSPPGITETEVNPARSISDFLIRWSAVFGCRRTTAVEPCETSKPCITRLNCCCPAAPEHCGQQQLSLARQVNLVSLFRSGLIHGNFCSHLRSQRSASGCCGGWLRFL